MAEDYPETILPYPEILQSVSLLMIPFFEMVCFWTTTETTFAYVVLVVVLFFWTTTGTTWDNFFICCLSVCR